MEKVREVIAYQGHFENFLKAQTEKFKTRFLRSLKRLKLWKEFRRLT